MNSFSSADYLEQHEKDCYLFKDQQLIMYGSQIKFDDQFNGNIQVVGFFDFECYNEKFVCGTCLIDLCICPKKTKTLVNQKAICYSLLIVNSLQNEIIYRETYTGYDAPQKLLLTLSQLQTSVKRYIKINIPIIMSEVDKDNFLKSEKCYLCGKKYTEKDGKVRDHCHATGKFLGAAHNSCNLGRSYQIKVPLYCHNFIGYDSHLLLTALKHLDPKRHKIKILPKNLEQITNLKVGMFTYNDSVSFLKSSLSELVSDLASEEHNFPYIKEMCCLTTEKNTELYKRKFNLMLSKGIFPYDFVTSIEQLHDCTRLPDKKLFYNSLIEEEISTLDYEKAETVFEVFKHKNMIDYMEFYCELDVYLLCEVFNKFRRNAIEDFKLDPARFVSLPSFAYQAMLKLTDAKIAACCDVDMYNMIKKGVRGGHSFISERVVKVRDHNDEDVKDFVKKNKNEDFVYIDCNNLYGSAMSYKMPVGRYKWMGDDEIKLLNVEDVDLSTDEFGYIAEVDLAVSIIFHYYY
jgi:hypothetical protein